LILLSECALSCGDASACVFLSPMIFASLGFIAFLRDQAREQAGTYHGMVTSKCKRQAYNQHEGAVWVTLNAMCDCLKNAEKSSFVWRVPDRMSHGIHSVQVVECSCCTLSFVRSRINVMAI
jgi:hypothetical protein